MLGEPRVHKIKEKYKKIEVKHDSCYFSIGNVQDINKETREKSYK